MKPVVEIYQDFCKNLGKIPLTFVHQGIRYNGLSDGFAEEKTEPITLQNGEGREFYLRHKASGLLFRLSLTVYPEYEAYEYVVYVDNDTSKDSTVLENMRWRIPFEGHTAVLKGITGDATTYYRRYSHRLTEVPYTFDTPWGRPSHICFPYFELEYGDDMSTVFALSWSGRWNASFVTDGAVAYFDGGQTNFSMYLKPGETIRTPLMAFVNSEGRDYDRAMAAWRRYFINCKLYKPGGKRMRPRIALADCSQTFTSQSLLEKMKLAEKRGITFDTYWLDAGWFRSSKPGEQICSIFETGMYEPDPVRFPNDMADMRQYFKEKGIDFLVWFEPELMRNEKESFLKCYPDFKEEWLMDHAFGEGVPLEGRLLNLGDKECVEWMFRHISEDVVKFNLAVYREDFNCSPYKVWVAHDEENRNGITENLYCQGHLRLWDMLHERFPGLQIDSCASGGGRDDLETLSRSSTLTYTDWYDMFPEDYLSRQAMTQEIFYWFPFFKNQIFGQRDMYHYRMNYAPLMIDSFEFVKEWTEKHTETVQKARKEFDRIKSYFYGDYYALFRYDRDDILYNGWMLYDREQQAGYVQVCRSERIAQGTDTEVVRLKGLEPDARYALKDFDGLVKFEASGKELMGHGFLLTTPESPYCSIILIKKI